MLVTTRLYTNTSEKLANSVLRKKDVRLILENNCEDEHFTVPRA